MRELGKIGNTSAALLFSVDETVREKNLETEEIKKDVEMFDNLDIREYYIAEKRPSVPTKIKIEKLSENFPETLRENSTFLENKTESNGINDLGYDGYEPEGVEDKGRTTDSKQEELHVSQKETTGKNNIFGINI